jgi:hypothetical protein
MTHKKKKKRINKSYIVELLIFLLVFCSFKKTTAQEKLIATTYKNLYLEDFNLKIECGDKKKCKIIDKELMIDTIPFQRGSDFSYVDIEDEYGDIKRKQICYEIIDYQVVLCDNRIKRKLLKKSLEDIQLIFEVNREINVDSIEVSGLSNPWVLHTYYFEKIRAGNFIKKSIHKSVFKEGGYLQMKIYFKIEGNEKFVKFWVKYFGSKQKLGMKKYKSSLRLNKIPAMESNGNCQ